MVSQPEAVSTSITLRGPSSVVSHSHRPSLSRTKRYNRSHTGGRTYAPQNEFPVFSNSGDVEIIVRAGPAEQRYLLHRHTLTRCSGFFEASTSVEWSRAQKPPALAGGNELARIGEDRATGSSVEVEGDRQSGTIVPGGRRRWRYELDPGSGEGDIPMLVQKDSTQSYADTKTSIFGAVPGNDASKTTSHSARPKPSHSHSASSASASSNHNIFRSLANLSLTGPHDQLSLADQDLLRDYDNLFRIFYNYPPILDGVNVADAYVQCKSLLTLGDQYDALAVVGPRIDHHLLQFQSRLWKQIAKYPISYLRLGYLARSRIIFQEALIHVVGQWPMGERSLRAALPPLVMDIIEDKVDELEEAVSRVDARLFRLGLVNSRGERITPSVHFLDWLAVCLFRQWLADHTTPLPPPAPPSSSDRSRMSSRDGPRSPPRPQSAPSIGRAYRTLGSPSPAAYLGHDECKRFLKLTPEMYSRDNLRRFEKRMDEIKAMARDVVRPLMGSGLELDMNGTSRGSEAVGYLTCTTVDDRDLPWPMD
ncbi:hypothetical protein NLU13_5155 [Sarocladium strictum]|uniref:BTB domain-containing protein n=1 Tax=Sarocladium strictum TaxID=5046 RepID=A0AA39GGC3_SARSR|nr:hypothetical protein NLU13_5155 [Sarocladium strictum]